MKIFSNIFKKRPLKKTKKILSFDGGGVRAIAGVIFLKKLEVETVEKSLIHLICLLAQVQEHLMQLV